MMVTLPARLGLSAALGLLLGDALFAQSLVLRNATVIDGTGAPPAFGRTIVIADGRIAEVHDGSRPAPPGVAVRDLTGLYVIPGLIDAHVHYATDPANAEVTRRRLAATVLGGVTAVRDMAGDAIVLRALADSARAPGRVSPRIYFSALVAGPSFFDDPRAASSAHGYQPGAAPWQRAIDSRIDLDRVMREAKSTGASGIKLYADLDSVIVRKATEAAHRQGMMVWSHAAVIPARPRHAVGGGVDVISHASFLVWEGAPAVPRSVGEGGTVPPPYESVGPDSPALATLFAAMRSRGTMLDPTIALMFARSERLTDSDAAKARRSAAWSAEVTRRAVEAGVEVVAGTDMNASPALDDLPPLHDELQALVDRVGLSPLQAIRAATANAARAITPAPDFGSIVPGARADLVILRQDPLRDIRATRTIVAVLRDGVVHDRPAGQAPAVGSSALSPEIRAFAGTYSFRADLGGRILEGEIRILARPDSLGVALIPGQPPTRVTDLSRQDSLWTITVSTPGSPAIFRVRDGGSALTGTLSIGPRSAPVTLIRKP